MLAALGGALAAAPTPAAAQEPLPAPSGTIAAVGSATVKPTPRDRKSERSIAKAVADAKAEVLPSAIASANARAKVLAEQSGLGLGALIGIADQAPSPFGFSGPFGGEGTFGPGRYCGIVPRFRITRLANGSVRRKRIGSRRSCRVPTAIATTVTVTYATARPPAA